MPIQPLKLILSGFALLIACYPATTLADDPKPLKIHIIAGGEYSPVE